MASEAPELETTASIKASLIAWWHGVDPACPLSLSIFLNQAGFSSIDEIWRKLRLWWNGYDDSLDEIAAEIEPAAPRHVQAPKKKQQDINARGLVAQALWGEGNLTPGPAEFIQEITSRLGLKAEMSMIDLGAGLGGPARAICLAYKTWITAYEAVPEYVKAGMEQSIMHGLGKKVPITQFSTEKIVLPKRKFDCIFSKEMMHHIAQKAPIIMEIESALKPGGQFCITNYIITDKGKDGAAVAAWNEADGKECHFWTKEEYLDAIAKAKLDLRVTEDLSERYGEMIAAGFRGFRKNMDRLIEKEDVPEKRSELMRAMAYETNRWAVRAEALRSGAIAVMRFSGLTIAQAEIR